MLGTLHPPACITHAKIWYFKQEWNEIWKSLPACSRTNSCRHYIEKCFKNCGFQQYMLHFRCTYTYGFAFQCEKKESLKKMDDFKSTRATESNFQMWMYKGAQVYFKFWSLRSELLVLLHETIFQVFFNIIAMALKHKWSQRGYFAFTIELNWNMYDV